jgi:hypothetical protein
MPVPVNSDKNTHAKHTSASRQQLFFITPGDGWTVVKFWLAFTFSQLPFQTETVTIHTGPDVLIQAMRLREQFENTIQRHSSFSHVVPGKE